MSKLGWVDFSPEHRARVRAVLDLLRTKGVLDELGIGVIRDSFSDTLFPGISTIQTRAKYFIIVPRILADFERLPVSRRRDAAEYLSRRERECLEKLVGVEGKSEALGIIGVSLAGTGRELQRQPSAIYWAGLRKYRLVNTPRSLTEFLAGLQGHERHTARYAGVKSEDDDGPGDSVRAPLIDVPYEEKWFEKLRIFLTPPEAQLLRDRMQWHVPGSLLAWILSDDDAVAEVSALASPTRFGALLASPFFTRIPADLQESILAARDFWALMNGAHILYNVLLQRRYNDGDADLERRWADWLGGVRADDLVGRWQTERLWDLARRAGHHVASYTCRFVERWTTEVLRSGPDVDSLERLVTAQEIANKGARARLRRGGERVKQEWIGIDELNYRFPQAARIIRDIHVGEQERA
jgi:hypothetical protein